MPKNNETMQSWQVFHFARKHLTRSFLYTIFGKKNARAVDYWCENPRHTAKPEGAYDPIQGVKALISELDDRGHCGVVRAAIAYIAEGTSCAFNHQEQKIVEPLSSLSEEILADFRAVSDLQRAIEAEDDIEAIEYYKLEAIAEIERTVALYRKEQQA
jgi:hypothetical protein